jgi:uncharacterized membrane protein
MSEQEFGSTPPAAETSSTEPAWGTPQPTYTPPPYGAPPPPAAAPGLSESAASALAYVTFIPAIIFLLVPPYNQSAKIRFHAIQELGLSVVMFVLSFFLIIPILGLLVYFVGFLAALVMWIMCIVKASQGSVFKLPVLGNFAAQQSGYVV